jgi:hypothetical protein
MSLTDAEKVYQHACRFCLIPIIILDKFEVDWEKLSGMGLSGYLCLTCKTELVRSSLKIVIRQLPGYKEKMLAV